MIFCQEGRVLNKALAGTGQLELLYGVLFSLGLTFQSILF